MLLSEVQSLLAKGIYANASALSYVTVDRGVSGFTVDDLGIGYCSFDSWDDLGVNLVGRVTFPIKSVSGDIVGFGGRILSGSEVKYKNSPASAVYDKSRTLYNLDIAQDYILDSGVAIVVEGYMDVAALWSAGIRNVVATCGTSMTKWHLRLLKRSSEKVVLMYDGDDAGVKSADRVVESLLPERHPLCVVEIPFGFDPADYVGFCGADGIMDLINNAKETKIS